MATKALTQDQMIAKINRKIAEFKKEFQGYSNIMSNGRRMFLESQTMDELAAGLKMVRLARTEMAGTLQIQGKAVRHMMNTLYDYALADCPPPQSIKTSKSRGYKTATGYAGL